MPVFGDACSGRDGFDACSLVNGIDTLTVHRPIRRESFALTPLEKSRRTGHWAQLLQRTLGKKALHHEHSVWRLRQQLTGPRCLLLDYAAHAQQQGKLRECADQLTRFPAKGLRQSQLGAVSAAYVIRQQLILCLAADATPADITMVLQVNINAVAKQWQYATVPAVERLARERMPFGRDPVSGQFREPSFMAVLPHDAWRNTFRQFAESYGWNHPGLLLVGESLAAIYGDTRTVEATVRTSILFAVNHERRPFGIVALLRVERLRGGCGVLLPDAWSTGYLEMNSEFSTGLQHAWYAIQQAHPGACDFDWRWSLDLNLGTRHLPQPPLSIPIGGHSAEAALACALWAIDRRVPHRPVTGDPLDVHVATTARFKHPGTDSLDLKPVTSVDIKTLAYPFVRRKIGMIVLSKEHDPDDLPPSNHAADADEDNVSLGAEPRFVEAATLSEAYQQLTRGPRISLAVKERQRTVATAMREKLCGPEVSNWRDAGRSYVRSPLAELLPQSLSQRGDAQITDRERHLSASELRAFSFGRWRSPTQRHEDRSSDELRAPRIRLFADSGLGKSVQLLLCEQKIAQSDREVIPVRLGKTDQDSGNLSAIHWNEDPDVILRNILKRCILKHVPVNDRPHAEKWFFSLVDHGKIVFLLDALDQSRDALHGLGSFLNSARLQACAVIVAGRPETRFSRSEAFEDLNELEWTTLKVLPFGVREQARLLGRHLASQLIPAKEGLHAEESDADEIRRHLWKDLLGVPLLLRFLKDLARIEPVNGKKGLHEYRNRYEIYRAAIAHLLEKGLSTVAGSPQVLKAKVEYVLPKIAFAAVRRHDFTAVVDGEAFQSVLEEIQNLYGLLLQVDLVTEHGVLDDVGPNGLEFRHRSMLEYFAGCQLADHFAFDSSPDSTAVKVLYSVQSVHERHDTFPEKDQLNLYETYRDLPAEWQWTLRFALAHAQHRHEQATDLSRQNVYNRLAWQLIRFGNPWVVYEAIDRDGLTFDTNLEKVCRWMVHRDYSRRDYHDAWKVGWPDVPPFRELCALTRQHWFQDGHATPEDALATGLAELLSSATWDAAYLQPLAELLLATSETAANDARLSGVAAVCHAALSDWTG